MLTKIICFVIGHQKSVSECPVTGAKKVTCLRCFPKTHTRGMSFN